MIIISGIPYNEPLSDDQKVQLPGYILPSGEANFYDFDQSSLVNASGSAGSGAPSSSSYPGTHPSGDLEYWLYKTYPLDAVTIDESGNPTYSQSILNYIENSGAFSNAKEIFDSSIYASGINTSGNATVNQSGVLKNNLFNDYIHYYPADINNAPTEANNQPPSGALPSSGVSSDWSFKIPFLAIAYKTKNLYNPYQ
jgi:hypothetical protein